MSRTEILNTILNEKLVAVVRLKNQNEVPEVVKAIIEGGINVLEITSNTPGYLEEIKKSRKLYPDMLIGAGTVTNTSITLDAINAGAQFLVTPNTSAEIVKIAHEHNIPVLMGALTPTEINNAMEAGADIVKLFPAGTLGINYYKAICGPFSAVKFFAVGGIDHHNAADWLSAGIMGLGLGSSLAKPIKNDEDYQNTIQRTKEFVTLVK